ncbi:hypothetical protein RI129_010317 [Pyrocoelia pectoralis]|uniref:MORN repeat-containing protein 5 n=1 Tax=Pyrocoelia pectoralis TaxID=417401 RepID=A0AAN7V4A3_9COLE
MTAAEDPKFFFGRGEFTLLNGDKYIGEFGAHRNGTVWREGFGTYISADNQVYEGEWIDDKLVNESTVNITFPTGEKFRGVIRDDKYSGPGIYTFDNQMEISCDFYNNQPTGRITLFDLVGNLWTEDQAVLLKENTFFGNISETQGLGKMKIKLEAEQEKVTKAKPNKIVERESLVFAKSTKTAYDINFKESKWYQRFLRYQTMVDVIARKSQESLELTEEEAKWYAKARQNRREMKQKLIDREKDRERKDALDATPLETLYSKSKTNTSSVLKVFGPSKDTRE